MPCITVRTNAKIISEKEEQMKAALGKAIALLPGKSESWLMLAFQGECSMYFKGEKNRPLAFVEVSVYGHADGAGCEKLTGEITRVLGETLSIPPDGIYIKYSETENWGWNGGNF